MLILVFIWWTIFKKKLQSQIGYIFVMIYNHSPTPWENYVSTPDRRWWNTICVCHDIKTLSVENIIIHLNWSRTKFIGNAGMDFCKKNDTLEASECARKMYYVPYIWWTSRYNIEGDHRVQVKVFAFKSACQKVKYFKRGGHKNVFTKKKKYILRFYPNSLLRL